MKIQEGAMTDESAKVDDARQDNARQVDDKHDNNGQRQWLAKRDEVQVEDRCEKNSVQQLSSTHVRCKKELRVTNLSVQLRFLKETASANVTKIPKCRGYVTCVHMRIICNVCQVLHGELPQKRNKFEWCVYEMSAFCTVTEFFTAAKSLNIGLLSRTEDKT